MNLAHTCMLNSAKDSEHSTIQAWKTRNWLVITSHVDLGQGFCAKYKHGKHATGMERAAIANFFCGRSVSEQLHGRSARAAAADLGSTWAGSLPVQQRGVR